MKTLIIVSHPYFGRSSVIKSLQTAAGELDTVTVRNLEELYGNKVDGFDIAAEQKAAEQADRIVFLFPIHWFGLTPMLKAYLNEIWSFGWAFGPGGTALKGKQLLVIASAGASPFTYSPDGLIQSTMEEVLTPFKACALYVGMDYLPPLTFLGAMGLNEEALGVIRTTFLERLAA